MLAFFSEMLSFGLLLGTLFFHVLMNVSSSFLFRFVEVWKEL